MINSSTCFRILMAAMLLVSGCGYTQKTVLPNDIKSIYVETVKNEVPIDQVYAHVPGVEIKVTNAVIKRLNQDGTLKVVSDPTKADAILESSMIQFQQEGARYSNLESVEEYKLYIALSLKLINAKTKETIWVEPNFYGDSEYFVSDVRSIGLNEAADRSVERLARNVVDRIVEDW